MPWSSGKIGALDLSVPRSLIISRKADQPSIESRDIVVVVVLSVGVSCVNAVSFIMAPIRANSASDNSTASAASVETAGKGALLSVTVVTDNGW